VSKNFNESTSEIEHVCGEVIFVDDQPEILRNYTRIFKNYQDIKVRMFSNGYQCYNWFNLLNCDICKKHLIFTDLSMPNMDGKILTQSLRNLSHFKFTIALVTAEEALVEERDLYD